MIVSGPGGGYAPRAQNPRCEPPLMDSHDIERTLNHSAQNYTSRHHERAGGEIAGHTEDDGSAPGGTGGIDRALNGRRVVGDAIGLGSERIHRCAERGLHRQPPQQSKWVVHSGDFTTEALGRPPERFKVLAP
jgi:hypothetical protein